MYLICHDNCQFAYAVIIQYHKWLGSSLSAVNNAESAGGIIASITYLGMSVYNAISSLDNSKCDKTHNFCRRL